MDEGDTFFLLMAKKQENSWSKQQQQQLLLCFHPLYSPVRCDMNTCLYTTYMHRDIITNLPKLCPVFGGCGVIAPHGSMLDLRAS